MKAFVIKNKEGKYYDCWSLGFTETINECAIYQDRQTAENDIKNCIKDNECLGYKDDCEVVEITIAEFDNSKREYNETIKYVETTEPDKVAEYIDNLEQQIAEKDSEIDSLKELRKLEIEDKKELRENRLREIIKFEKELAEKDKEIEELKKQIGDIR